MTKILFSLIIFFSVMTKASATVGVGGYVPFAFATQKDPDGGDNKFTFHPMFTLNTIFPFYAGHLALPEFGVVFHRNSFDGLSKKTIFILWDVGLKVTPSFLFRYGLGTFLTRIGSDGGTVDLPNGNDTLAFAKPNGSSTSWNTTINLGFDFAYDANYTVKVESYVFGMFDSEKRELSYSLSLNYYL